MACKYVQASHSILLRNETILFHESQNVRLLKEHDLLIEGNLISNIGQDLVLPPGCKEIDCTSKIISPRFIDAHRHLWQSQVRFPVSSIAPACGQHSLVNHLT